MHQNIYFSCITPNKVKRNKVSIFVVISREKFVLTHSKTFQPERPMNLWNPNLQDTSTHLPTEPPVG